MNAVVGGLLLVVVVLLAVLLVVLARRGETGLASSLQQQLIELRNRLDVLTARQLDVPRTLAEGQTEQLRSLSDVRERLARLSEATLRLETVGKAVAEVQELLKVPKLRGLAGETVLEELLAQVFPAALYETQYAFSSGERVDAVVRLGGRLVPIDSKFPLEACQRMLRADEHDAARERRLLHKTLRDRIDEIADRYVRPDEGTYDFAFMYIPAETVYYEAVVRADDTGDLVAYALGRKVIPVSPNTFYAYLAAVLHGLKGLEVEKRAHEIVDALGGLQQQVVKFGRGHELMGKHLHNALKQYDDTRRLLERMNGQLAGLTGIGAQVPDRENDGGATLPAEATRSG